MLRTISVLIFATLCVTSAAKESRSEGLSFEAVNNAQWTGRRQGAKLGPTVLKAQVLIKRAGFSPGVIDARGGKNFQKALRAYQQANALPLTGTLDESTWSKLAEHSKEEVLQRYTISEGDVKGPFVDRIPKDFEKMAELERLGYRSPRELLAEKFHMTEQLLTSLNRGKELDRPGTEILVPNVAPLELQNLNAKRHDNAEDANTGAKTDVKRKTERLVVHKSERSVRIYGEGGKLIAYYPASVGSVEKPAPSGKYEVRNISFNPTYRYDPKYGFKGQKAQTPVEVAPGPNNPVGLVWIALSAKSYGIHGTPAPETVGKAESHGCVRLTNWDAVAVAKLVRKGTPVEFVD